MDIHAAFAWLEGQPPSRLHKLIAGLRATGVVGTLGSWQTFLQARVPDTSSEDPVHHHAEVLLSFLHSIADLAGEQAQSQAAPSPCATGDLPAAQGVRMVLRFVRHMQRQQKEAALGATSCPAMVPGAAPWPPLEPCTTAAGPTTEAGSAQGPGSSSPSSPEPASWARSARVWSLVRASLKHPKNHQLFRFPSWKIGWARTKRRVVAAPDPAAGPSSEQNQVPRLLALDCEMCETEAEQHCLLGLSLVDQQGAVLYKTLVKPRDRVLDYRTEFTGLTAMDLEDVNTTRSQARARVKALLLQSVRNGGPPSVLVGHALHHDLRALRLDHLPFIDTSLIFSYAGLPDCTPALRDLSRLVLGQDMAVRSQGRHDSSEDAGVALRLVLQELAAPQRSAPLRPPEVQVDKAQLCKLLVHGYPAGTTRHQLLALFSPPATCSATTNPPTSTATSLSTQAPVPTTGPQPIGFEEDTLSKSAPDASSTAGGGGAAGGGGLGSRAVLVFGSVGDANAAFKLLPGSLTKDALGRPEKVIRPAAGTQAGQLGRWQPGQALVCKVRKMAGHNGQLFTRTAVPQPAAAAAAAGGRSGTPSQKARRPAQQRSPRKQGQGPPRAAKVDPQAVNGKRKRKAAALAAA
ncbi:hypothetical protein V8C86DRAFT_3130968 [Haematococcus lacustris]